MKPKKLLAKDSIGNGIKSSKSLKIGKNSLIRENSILKHMLLDVNVVKAEEQGMDTNKSLNNTKMHPTNLERMAKEEVDEEVVVVVKEDMIEDKKEEVIPEAHTTQDPTTFKELKTMFKDQTRDSMIGRNIYRGE